jgi:hypothetical protein
VRVLTVTGGQEFHFHVPYVPGATVFVHIGPPLPAARDGDEEIAAMLDGLALAGGQPVRLAYDGLAERRYVPRLGKPARMGARPLRYIRFHDADAPGAAATCYLMPARLDFPRPADRNALHGMPGAVPKLRGVMFPLSTADDAGYALAAADKVKASAP